MIRQCLLGVDVGTGATKAVVCDLDGATLGASSVPSRLHHPKPGWVEQDPAQMEEELAAAIRGALEAASLTGADIAAVALDGQMAGIIGVGAAGEAVTHYDSWLDNRCAPYMRKMKARGARIVELTGGFPSYTHGPKILWWMHERPEVFADVRAFTMPASWLAMRLAGRTGDEAFIDPTYLHFSSLADTRAEIWSDELLDAFDVPRDVMPSILQPWEVVGEVTGAMAERTGLAEGTAVAAGCGDTAAGLLGGGVVRPGTSIDVAGSASVLASCVERFEPDVDAAVLLTARTVLPGVYYALAYLNGGGLNLGWFRERFARELSDDEAYAHLEREAAEVPPGAEGVRFLPHLGGRVTPNEPDLRGMAVGFGWSHGRGHVYRAMLESVAYEYAIYLRRTRDLHGAASVRSARVVGGGARSALWNQIKADVLDLPYEPVHRHEGGALGSALVAGKAVGLIPDLAAAAERFNPVGDHRFEPDPDRHETYRAHVDGYERLLEAGRALFADDGAPA